MIKFGKIWEAHLPIVEFPYNCNHPVDIKATPFEALYGQKCRSSLCWAETGGTHLAKKKVLDCTLIGPEIIGETTAKIIQIQERLKASRDQQKNYVDK